MNESKRKVVAELYLGLLNLQVEREQHDFTDQDLNNWLCPKGFDLEDIENLQFIGQKALQDQEVLSPKEVLDFMDLIGQVCDAVHAEISIRFISGEKE